MTETRIVLASRPVGEPTLDNFRSEKVSIPQAVAHAMAFARPLHARPDERCAVAEGLTNCKFQKGDASNLDDLKDGSFDLVVSIFGAMFAPKPFDVAKEMVRVTRPGGRIVMGNWIPNDPTLVVKS
jgi:SAM-dependent methyltransferase